MEQLIYSIHCNKNDIYWIPKWDFTLFFSKSKATPKHNEDYCRKLMHYNNFNWDLHSLQSINHFHADHFRTMIDWHISKWNERETKNFNNEIALVFGFDISAVVIRLTWPTQSGQLWTLNKSSIDFILDLILAKILNLIRTIVRKFNEWMSSTEWLPSLLN